GILTESSDVKKFYDMVDEAGFVKNFEARTGPRKWVSIHARKVINKQGDFLYHEGIVEDITSRKKAEEDLTNTLNKLRKAMEGVIQAMAMAVETRDPYTAGHQKRVANLARAIAQEMGMDGAVVDGVRMASAIHDIGKIAVPAEILSKPSKLSDLELSMINIHPLAGHDILKEIEFPWPIADIVLQHHEKIDGSGYPSGLKGENIRIESRIVCVADVVEAMGSHRPYRPIIGVEKALEEISSNSGALYDHEVVEACLRLFRQKGFSLE
ncbi:MAG: HD-GYP domain-containing protein, partial [Smithellaceae bacterium]|nr:HD-GYP domain-containing protein [Smithellaceae bacterium]